MARAATAGKKALWDWISDWIIAHWPQIVITLSGVAMTYLAAVTLWLRAYGPVAVAGVVLLALVMLSFAYWMYARGTLNRSEARYREMQAIPPTTVNPLRSTFENERIRASDFYSPLSGMHHAKTFNSCEIVGPGAIALMACNLYHGHFIACDVVAVKTALIKTAAGFEHCTFNNCKFINATIFVSHGTAESISSIPTDNGRPMEVIGFNA